MKKIIWIAAAGLIAAVACQKETPAVSLPEGEEVMAVLLVSVPENIATKTYSDGKLATDLHYAVYDGKKGTFLLGSDQPLKMNADLTCRVEIRLVKNYEYDIVFWAQAPEAPYRFDKGAARITVTDNYTNWANDERRDAFYQVVNDYVYVPKSTDVDLYRPFAQINFGAADYDEVTALGLAMTSTAEITNLPNVLNVLDRTVSGEVTAKFTAAPVPAVYSEKLSINGNEDAYAFVSMNYVLAPQEQNELALLPEHSTIITRRLRCLLLMYHSEETTVRISSVNSSLVRLTSRWRLYQVSLMDISKIGQNS